MSRQPVAEPKVSRPADEHLTMPHHVYRLFSEDGALLYIGCARSVQDRIYMHLNTCTLAGWDVIRSRYHHHTSEMFPTKAAARAAERQAITDEAPLVNRQHNPKRWRRVADRYVPVVGDDDDD